MLNKDNQRMLSYITTILELKPIPNYDRVEHARVNGWWCVVRKGEFKVGDKAVYFEVDSKVPETDDRFAFMQSKGYKVKTQKMCKVYSQGLIMPLNLFPECQDKEENDDVTELLGITYYIAEDNQRKSRRCDSNEKYNRMSRRYPKLAKTKWFRWFMKRQWGKDLLFLFLGKPKNDTPKDFPEWIRKTDECRIENAVFELSNKDKLIKTEKIDGTSGTFFLDKSKKKPEFGVCSRNMRQVDIEQKNYHTGSTGDNVYWEAAMKYNIKEVLNQISDEYLAQRVVIQGEIYGDRIQGNPYKLDERRFAAFNLITDGDRLNSIKAKEILEEYDIPFVPIVDENYIMPDDLEEFKLEADGYSEINPKCRREGFVYRGYDGIRSFKNVSREFLLKKKD